MTQRAFATSSRRRMGSQRVPLDAPAGPGWALPLFRDDVKGQAGRPMAGVPGCVQSWPVSHQLGAWLGRADSAGAGPAGGGHGGPQAASQPRTASDAVNLPPRAKDQLIAALAKLEESEITYPSAAGFYQLNRPGRRNPASFAAASPSTRRS